MANVTCSCGSRLKVTPELISKQVTCPSCGKRWLLEQKNRTHQQQTALATTAQKPAVLPRQYKHTSATVQHSPHYATAPPNAPLAHDSYPTLPDNSSHQLTSFPVIMVVLMHFLTLGLFTQFWLVSLHGKLPKIREDDPSGGRAIGYLFIPLFNLYWMAFCCHRLCVRLNEQLAAMGTPVCQIAALIS